MELDVNEVERDILEAAYTLGRIGYFGGSHSPASQSLFEKYDKEDDDVSQSLTVVLNWLIEERYLFPFFDANTGKELSLYARGITPKGYRRLQELRHPVRTWIRANWFGVLVLCATVLIGVGSMAVSLIVNSD